MKKFLLSFMLLAVGITCWADEYYLVGDATPCGWVTGDARKLTQLTETATPGVYEWTGILKNGGAAAGNGFYICTALGSWTAIYPSTEEASMAIAEIGESEYQTETEKKWNPVNTDWQYYTITLNTNTGKVSWVAGESFAADAEGFYNIGSAKDLYWFSVIVNNSNQSVKAKLTADIDYTAYPKGFIGTNDKKFAGIFDGQEHTVTLAINNDVRGSGLFGVINGATIKNLVIDGTIETSQKWIGGIAGLTYGNNTVENIVVNAAIKFTGKGDATLGGLFGDIESASTIKNCAFYGSVNAPEGDHIRGLASWCSNNPTFTNCIIAPTKIIANSGSDFANGNYVNNNCVKVAADDAKLASGELCYTMNGDQSVIGWYQNLSGDVDAKPVPFSSHSQVYANGALKCDGTSAGGELTYSNNKTGLIPPHTDENGDGRCDVCGKLIPDYLTLDENGFYEIASGADLNWFAAWVKEEKQNAKAKLTADIDYTAYPQGFIGVGAAFQGVFDGQMYTITIAMVNDAKIRGLFAKVDGATIKNLIIDGSVTSDFNNLGGLGGQVDGNTTIENVIVKATLTYTAGSGDASCGGFFPYINSGTTTFKNCAFYGSLKLGSANGNAGLVSWSSGNCNAENCLVAPTEVEASAFDDYARGGKTITNCYKVAADDAKLTSGELCYLLNGDQSEINWYQTIGADALPSLYNESAQVLYVGEANYATFFDATQGYEMAGDVEAYAGIVKGQYVSLTSIGKDVPAETPVVLKGTYYNKRAADVPAVDIANQLKGSDGTVKGNGSIYALANKDNGVGFYLVADGTTIPAGKAYLQASNAVKEFIPFTGDETAIKNVNGNDNANNGAIYNIAGQRLNKMQKGLNIVGGKKVMY